MFATASKNGWARDSARGMVGGCSSHLIHTKEKDIFKCSYSLHKQNVLRLWQLTTPTSLHKLWNIFVVMSVSKFAYNAHAVGFAQPFNAEVVLPSLFVSLPALQEALITAFRWLSKIMWTKSSKPIVHLISQVCISGQVPPLKHFVTYSIIIRKKNNATSAHFYISQF